MKKYEKPAVEIIEANLVADYMLSAISDEGGTEAAPGRKNKDYDEDDFDDEGW